MSDDDLQSITTAVLEADDRRRAASVAGDVAALGEILAPDFTYIHNTGFREGRETYLARMSEGRVLMTALERLAANVRLAGDVVLIDGEAMMAYRLPPTAPEASFTSLYLAVWQQVDGRWQIKAYASTLSHPENSIA